LKAKEEFHPRVLESIDALAALLVSEVRTMERGTDQMKRDAKEQVPNERVKDAAAMARELRWRIRFAAGNPSDDEDSGRFQAKIMANGNTADKRKRVESDDADDKEPKFKNFKPRLWESVVERTVECEVRVLKAQKPDGRSEDWKKSWIDWRDEVTEMDEGDAADVKRQRDVVVKLRRTTNGVERQRVERVVEEWIWSGQKLTAAPPSTGHDSATREVDSTT